jgi:hypothetical protein
MPTHVITANGVSADPNTGDVDVVIKKKEVTLIDSQIKALPTTPVDIIPAPGAGKAIIVFGGSIKFNIVAGYTNVSASVGTGVTQLDLVGFGVVPSDNVNTITNNNQNIRIKLSLLSFNFQDTDHDVVNGVSSAGFTKSVSDLNLNEALKLYCYNVTQNNDTDLGNFTGGNAANTLKVTVFYSIVDL